jgi:hypothetical protein
MEDWELIKRKIIKYCCDYEDITFAKLNPEELTQYYYISTYPIQIFTSLDEGKTINGIENNEKALIQTAKVAKKCHQLIERIGKQMKKFTLSKRQWKHYFNTIAKSYNNYLQK